MNLYYKKYLKYKEKYNLLKNQFGGLRFIINGKEMDGIHLQERLNDGFVYKGVRDRKIYNQIQNFIENERYFEIAPELDEEYNSEVDLDVDSEVDLDIDSEVDLDVDSEFDSLVELEPQAKAQSKLSVDTTIHGNINDKIYLFKSEDEFLTKKGEYLHAVEILKQSQEDFERKERRLSEEFLTPKLQKFAVISFNSAKIIYLINKNNLNIIIEKIKLNDINNKMDEATFHRDFFALSNLSEKLKKINVELDRLYREKEELKK
jgi:hypothetical protein